jgi:c(7)-type cytochrome triheme protein
MRYAIIVLLLSALAGGTALAVYPSQTITFAGGEAGPVAFSGCAHGQPCSRCHNQQTFPRMQQGEVTITMAAIDEGRLCGSCHNGRQAFASQGNCQRCHQSQ